MEENNVGNAVVPVGPFVHVRASSPVVVNYENGRQGLANPTWCGLVGALPEGDDSWHVYGLKPERVTCPTCFHLFSVGPVDGCEVCEHIFGCKDEVCVRSQHPGFVPLPASVVMPEKCDHATGNVGCKLVTCQGIPFEPVLDSFVETPSETVIAQEWGAAKAARALTLAMREVLGSRDVTMARYADSGWTERSGVRKVQGYEFRAGACEVRIVSYESQNLTGSGPSALLSYGAVYVDGNLVDGGVPMWGADVEKRLALLVMPSVEYAGVVDTVERHRRRMAWFATEVRLRHNTYGHQGPPADCAECENAVAGTADQAGHVWGSWAKFDDCLHCGAVPSSKAAGARCPGAPRRGDGEDDWGVLRKDATTPVTVVASKETAVVNAATRKPTKPAPACRYEVGQRVEVLEINFEKPGFPEEWRTGVVTRVGATGKGLWDVHVQTGERAWSPQIVGPRGGNKRIRPICAPGEQGVLHEGAASSVSVGDVRGEVPVEMPDAWADFLRSLRS